MDIHTQSSESDNQTETAPAINWTAGQSASFVLIIILCGIILYNAYSPEDIYISDLQYEVITAELYDPRNDESAVGKPLTIQVKEQPSFYAKGIGLHANSEIFVRFVPDGYTHFAAEIGVDAVSGNSESSIIFMVYAGGSEGKTGTSGTLLYESPVLKANMNPLYIEAPVYGRRSLTLTVRDAMDGNNGDFAVWGMARFMKR